MRTHFPLRCLAACLGALALVLSVNAVTPVEIAQQAYLKGSQTPDIGSFRMQFGSSVAVSGDTVVVGRPVTGISASRLIRKGQWKVRLMFLCVRAQTGLSRRG